MTIRVRFALVLPPCLVLAAAPLRGAEPATTRTVYVPTSASIHGAAGAFFHTDLTAMNRSFTTPLDVTATYRCFAGPCAPATATFTLAPRESTLVSDVDATLFGEPGTAGAIELTYTASSEELAVGTRTYTPSLPAPTNGTSIPGATYVDMRSRAVFPGLAANGGDLSSGFRSNAGAYNPNPEAVYVVFSLFDGTGNYIGSAARTLAATSATQINDIFSAAGAGSLQTMNAFLVVTATESLLPFVTVIDNQSGDSIYVPAMRDDIPTTNAQYLTNPNFDSGIDGWTNVAPSFINLSWAAGDYLGSPFSGTIQVVNSDANPNGGGNGAAQCVTIPPNATMTMVGRVYVPSGQSATGHVALNVDFFPSSDCTGTPVLYTGAPETPVVGHFDTWVTMSGIALSPPNASSALFTAWTAKNEPTGTFTALFDGLFLVSSPY